MKTNVPLSISWQIVKKHGGLKNIFEIYTVYISQNKLAYKFKKRKEMKNGRIKITKNMDMLELYKR